MFLLHLVLGLPYENKKHTISLFVLMNIIFRWHERSTAIINVISILICVNFPVIISLVNRNQVCLFQNQRHFFGKAIERREITMAIIGSVVVLMTSSTSLVSHYCFPTFLTLNFSIFQFHVLLGHRLGTAEVESALAAHPAVAEAAVVRILK